MNKFDKLKSFLTSNDTDSVVLTEKKLNELIDGGLNENAFSSRSYFSNDVTHAIYRAWRECGYYCSKVNRYEKYIVLTKTEKSGLRMISSDILFNYYISNYNPNFTIVITPFTFAELCRSKGIKQKPLIEYILNISPIFIDYNGKSISFDEFYKLVNQFGKRQEPLINRMKYTYINFVTYVFSTCLVNIDTDLNNIIDYLSLNPYLPINFFNNIMNKRSLFDCFLTMCENIVTSKSFNQIISEIKILDIKYLQKFMVECDPLELLFYDYALENFIFSLRAKGEFDISPKLVEEMLNVSLLNICKDFLYITNQKYTTEILVSGIRNRIVFENRIN